jgi:two-component system, sensor histidine kinase RpfC
MVQDNKLEIEQTLLRIIGIFISSVYLYWLSSEGILVNKYMVIGLGVLYLSIAVTLKIFAELEVFPGVVRRYFGILLDVSMTTSFMILMSGYGAPLYAIYLWVTVGNGFRYGNTYLYFSMVLSIAGFSIVSYYDSFWKSSELFVVMCFVVLVFVPFYVGALLRRITSEKNRAEQASKEKSRFIANVSHEIRTPLNVIVGLGGMMDKVSVDEQREMMMRVKEASGSLMDLVEGVLDMSSIESGEVRTRHEAFDLPRLLASVDGIFSMQAGRKGLQMKSTIDSALPVNVMGDQQRLRQVLINLVGNAVKFTGKGKVEMRATRVNDEAGGEEVCFEVIDTGPGMTSEFLLHIFDPFRQEDDTIARRYGGTGLGTSISRNLVELMGGRMGVESVYGQGSRFWFTHPLVPAPVDVVKADEGMAEKQIVEPVLVRNNGACARVLVVEDNEINCYVYRTMFNYLGVETEFAGSGPVALEKLARESYDMLVFDMQIPGMSGAETISRYNEMVPSAQRPPVIVITGDATTEVEHICQQLGVRRLLAKPVSIDRIRELVQRFIVAPSGEFAV